MTLNIAAAAPAPSPVPAPRADEKAAPQGSSFASLLNALGGDDGKSALGAAEKGRSSDPRGNPTGDSDPSGASRGGARDGAYDGGSPSPSDTLAAALAHSLGSGAASAAEGGASSDIAAKALGESRQARVGLAATSSLQAEPTATPSALPGPQVAGRRAFLAAMAVAPGSAPAGGSAAHGHSQDLPAKKDAGDATLTSDALAAALAQSVGFAAAAGNAASDLAAEAGSEARRDSSARAARIGSDMASGAEAEPHAAPTTLPGLRVAGRRAFLATLETVALTPAKAAASATPALAQDIAAEGDGGATQAGHPASDRALEGARGETPPNENASLPAAREGPSPAGNLPSAAAAIAAGQAIGGSGFAENADEAQAPAREAPVEAPTRVAASPRAAVKELDLALDPKDLGSLSMTLRLSGDALSVVIKAASAHAVSAIESERTAIAARLAAIDQPLAALVIERTDSARSSPETPDGPPHDASDPRQQQADSRQFDNDASSQRRDPPPPPRGGALGRHSGDLYL